MSGNRFITLMLCDENRLTGNRRCDILNLVKHKDTSLLSVGIYIDIKGGTHIDIKAQLTVGCAFLRLRSKYKEKVL